MLIPSAKLRRYLPKILFPLAVLEETSDRVIRCVSQQEFEGLIALGAVFGVGTKGNLKRVRMRTRPAPLDVEKSQHAEPSVVSSADAALAWRAECNFTVQRQQLSCGVVYRHHPKHCEAFSPQLGMELEPSCL